MVTLFSPGLSTRHHLRLLHSFNTESGVDVMDVINAIRSSINVVRFGQNQARIF